MGGKRLGVGRLLDKGPAIIGDIVAALVGLLMLAAVVALVVRVVKEESTPKQKSPPIGQAGYRRRRWKG